MRSKENKSPVSIVITDLDNTLWDWFDSWYASFNTLLTGLAEQTGIARTQLEKEAREIHQRRGTSEYSWLLYEMPSIISFCGTEDPFRVFSGLLHQQNSARLKALKLYPGVEHTLLTLRRYEVPIVGYTESQSYWTRWRIQKLKLDGVIDSLYSSPDHDGPDDLDPREKRYQPEIDFSLRFTQHKYVPSGIAKPNPKILKQILHEYQVSASEGIYVGDNLLKDVAMAQAAKVPAAHAVYGIAHQIPAYEQLRRVSHWTDHDIQRERDSICNRDIVPDIRLTKGFSELLEIIRFT